MTKKRKTLFILGILLMALGVACLSYSLIRDYLKKRDMEELHSIAYRETTAAKTEATEIATSEEETAPTQTETEEITTTKEPYVSPIDFEALWEVNPDIYAWLEIANTEIAYPVLQHATDNSYYLNHTPEHKSGFPGSIFTYNVNAKDFSDFNTVIYGHRMNNGLMFSNLHDFRDESYLMEHRTIKIYLPERELIYTIFAAVVYDDRLITSAFDFSDPESCSAYLKSIFENRDMNSHVLEEPAVTNEDHIITLSTCVKGQPSKRYLVVAVLTDEIE